MSRRREAVERWVPGARVARTYRARLVAARPRRGHRAGRDPRAAGDGVRRARRRAGGVRALHDDRLPGRLRGLRAVARARARPGLVGVAADLRRDRPARGARRRADPRRARRHARPARRPHRDRDGAGPARVRRRSAVERGPGRLHERPRHHDHRGAAAEAVRLLDRRDVVRRRGRRVVRASRRDEGRRAHRRASACSSCCSCCPA